MFFVQSFVHHEGITGFPLLGSPSHMASFQALMASLVPRAILYIVFLRLERGCSSISSSVILIFLVSTPSSSRACLLRRDQLAVMWWGGW